MKTLALSIVFFVLAALFGAVGFLYKSGTAAASGSITSYLLNTRILGGVVCYVAVMVLFIAPFVLNALPMWRRSIGHYAMQQLRDRLIEESCGLILFPEGTRGAAVRQEAAAAAAGRVVRRGTAGVREHTERMREGWNQVAGTTEDAVRALDPLPASGAD